MSLCSCSLRNEPPRAIVIEALQSQILATQASIAQSLDFSLASIPDVSRVRVDHQDVLKLESVSFIWKAVLIGNCLETAFAWTALLIFTSSVVRVVRAGIWPDLSPAMVTRPSVGCSIPWACPRVDQA